MPIEIREIVIKTTVNEEGSSQGRSSSISKEASSSGKENNNLLQECVNQVIQILNDKKER